MTSETDKRDIPTALPLVSYEIDVFSQANCRLRFVLARPDDPPATGSETVQIRMTVSQAETLVQDLRKMIAQILLERSLSLTVGREQK